MEDLKARKENFVSGLTGGTIHEIYLVTSISLVTYFGYCLVNTFTDVVTSGLGYEVNVFTFILDFLLSWTALLLSITIYSDNISVLTYAILIPAVTLVATNYTRPKPVSTRPPKLDVAKLTKKQLLPKQAYLTVYRSQMIVVTAIAILAVDFNVFPRRFAKCETWGTSLMDLGVGSFVFSMGIVSARSSIWSKYCQEKLGFWKQFSLLFQKILHSFKDSFTVFLLGIGRLVLVKVLNYQEHESEYGVHWNFFVTLSLLQPSKYIMEFVFSILRLNNFNLVIGLAISLAYEWLLQANDGSYLAYLLSDQRTNLVDQNKEGVSSLVGYLAIYLVGESTGGFLLPAIVTPFNLFKNSTKQEIEEYHNNKSPWAKYFSLSSDYCLLIYTIAFDLLAVIVQSSPAITSISRRFANFQYVLFVIAYNLNYLMGFKIIGKFFNYFKPQIYSNVPYCLEAINSNGLLVFLVSNLLTGLINMTFNTLDTPPMASVAILIAYCLAINAVSCYLYSKNIFIKL